MYVKLENTLVPAWIPYSKLSDAIHICISIAPNHGRGPVVPERGRVGEKSLGLSLPRRPQSGCTPNSVQRSLMERLLMVCVNPQGNAAMVLAPSYST